MAVKDSKALKEFILQRVRVYDYLLEDGFIRLKSDMEQQINCPFHGADNKPSARYYSETNSLYCWVCQKSWDPISYTMQKSNAGFIDALKMIVRKHKLDVGSVPDFAASSAYKAKRMIADKSKNSGTQVNPVRKMLAYIESELSRKRRHVPASNLRNIVYILPRLRKANPDDAAMLAAATKVANFLKGLQV